MHRFFDAGHGGGSWAGRWFWARSHVDTLAGGKAETAAAMAPVALAHEAFGATQRAANTSVVGEARVAHGIEELSSAGEMDVGWR